MNGPTLIYHFQSSQNLNGDFRPARYKVIFFFDQDGFLGIPQLQELAKSVPDADHHELTFLNLDDLKAFAHRVAQELQTREVRLMSVQDYNIGIDGAKDLSSFKEIFNRFGEVIINEAVAKKKGLLGKIFG